MTVFYADLVFIFQMLDLYVGAINYLILQSKKLKADKYFAKRQKTYQLSSWSINSNLLVHDSKNNE